MPEVLVSAIVPAYRRSDKLRKAVESLLSQDLDTDQYEVIVVDSSPDDTNAEVIRSIQSTARCPLRFFSKGSGGPRSVAKFGRTGGTR